MHSYSCICKLKIELIKLVADHAVHITANRYAADKSAAAVFVPDYHEYMQREASKISTYNFPIHDRQEIGVFKIAN